MIHTFVLNFPNINLTKIYNLTEVRGDTITFNFTVDGVDLTGYQIRGEVYDLNTSIRMCTSNVPDAGSAPAIVVSDLVGGVFSATVGAGLTGTFQKYGQVEFELTSPAGAKYTIFSQLIMFLNERIIWDAADQGVTEISGGNPLF